MAYRPAVTVAPALFYVSSNTDMTSTTTGFKPLKLLTSSRTCSGKSNSDAVTVYDFNDGTYNRRVYFIRAGTDVWHIRAVLAPYMFAGSAAIAVTFAVQVARMNSWDDTAYRAAGKDAHFLGRWFAGAAGEVQNLELDVYSQGIATAPYLAVELAYNWSSAGTTVRLRSPPQYQLAIDAGTSDSYENSLSFEKLCDG